MGCEDESVAEMKRVLSLDPLSLVGNMTATAIFWILRRFDDAVELGRRTLELDPCFAPTHWALGFAYGDSGRYEAARAELENAIQISNGEAVHIAVLGYVHAKAGKRDEALRIVAELTGLSKQRYIMPLWLAMIYAPLNERDLAFQWLEEAYRDRSSWMVYSERAMWLDNLRSDPRFEDLRRRIKSVS
jgi:tetratricopeptide (TPR) repeat protein